MTDVRKRFTDALKDTVNEWKSHENVKGIFVYGSYVRGTATANSDLDICIVWGADEAPVRLMSTHKEVLVDMVFMTVKHVENVFGGETKDVTKISEVINRLRNSLVMHDTDGMASEWQNKTVNYVWSEESISQVKDTAMEYLNRARKFVEEDEGPSAIFEMRQGLFDLGRVILMVNNIFLILKPAEVLTEVRMLDPMTYSLFLRAFKLKGMDEPKLLAVLKDLRQWLDIAESRISSVTVDDQALLATGLLSQAQREYHGSLGLTYNGDYELAVLEMRQAACSLGRTLITLKEFSSMVDGAFMDQLSESEPGFYEEILVEHGAYDILPKEISRIIGEAQFIAQRF
ncbi:MAG: nucleotidyltransferase domain-containing protein [Candidatus Thorarchaeota archaeon]|nr:nucleotidyltransferase domain-containing protein [Candidatus Thorarchaeota archaeon]